MPSNKSWLLEFIKEKINWTLINIQKEIQHYHEIKDIENDKLVVPIVKRAYNCLFIHYFFLVSTFLVYSILGVNDRFTIILNILIAIFVVSFSLLLRKYSYINFIKNNILKATNIYIFVNLLAPISTTIGFKYWMSNDVCDESIMVVYSCYWLVHFFNLVPGKFTIKISLYFSTSFLIFAISRPSFTISIAVIISTVLSFGIQSYIVWSKYHEDSVLLNKVEAEKSINNYLQELNTNPIFNLNKNLEIIKMNLSASKLFNEKANTSFKDLAEGIHFDVGENLYHYILSNQTFQNKEFFKNSKRGIEKWIVSSNTFEFGKEFNRVVVLQNITDIVNKHEAEISEKYQNLILFSASHEIRTNLNLITGNLNQIRTNFDEKLITIAQDAAKIMETKLNLLMDFVQIMNGTFNGHRVKFNLRSLIEEVEEILKRFSVDKNLFIKIKYKNKFDEEIECDYNRIFSILIHIGLNSVKFTLKGSISIKFFVHDGYLNIILSDTGIGMDSTLVNQINDVACSCRNLNYEKNNNLFYNVKENKFLTGLGLQSASLICKSLGGSLFVKSKKEIGTIFQIKIQAIKVCDLYNGIADESCIILSSCKSSVKLKYEKYLKKDCLQKEILEPQEISSLHLRTLAIIIVDDQFYNRKVLVDMLKGLQYKDIIEAENGLESIKKCDEIKDKYNQITIFMDIEMPVMNSIEATRILKEKDKINQIKIVMQTAFDGEDIIRACFEAGAIDFCSKPISFQKLKQFKEEKIILF